MIAVGWTTLSKESDAMGIGRTLIEKQLAFCAQVSSPIQSIYRWNDQIETGSEYRLTLKFLIRNNESLQAELLSLHPYENPQWIWCRADGVSDAYLDWARGQS